MTSTEEAFLLLSHADNYLRYAETNRRSGIYGPAVSMAYHASFYAAQAVVAYHREGPKTQKGSGASSTGSLSSTPTSLARSLG